MLLPEKLQSIFLEKNIDPANIYHILKRGIDIEQISLEIAEQKNESSIESYVRIIEGERFLNLVADAAEISQDLQGNPA